MSLRIAHCRSTEFATTMILSQRLPSQCGLLFLLVETSHFSLFSFHEIFDTIVSCPFTSIVYILMP